MQASLERLRRRHEEGEGGFTLIELLIVIVILAILAAIVVFAVQNLSSQSATAACQSDYKTVETASEMYKAQVGVYPGGTVPTGLTATPLAATASMTAADETAGGDLALMGTVTEGSTTLGPWLKDYPLNGTHYQIQVSNDGKDTIQVYDAAGTATLPAAGTATEGDCSSVS
jgi:general secretion pathway protein G